MVYMSAPSENIPMSEQLQERRDWRGDAQLFGRTVLSIDPREYFPASAGIEVQVHVSVVDVLAAKPFR